MTASIDSNHVLIDLSTMQEVKGAQYIDDDGNVTVIKPDRDNQMKQSTLQLQHGSWKIVKRGR